MLFYSVEITSIQALGRIQAEDTSVEFVSGCVACNLEIASSWRRPWPSTYSCRGASAWTCHPRPSSGPLPLVLLSLSDLCETSGPSEPGRNRLSGQLRLPPFLPIRMELTSREKNKTKKVQGTTTQSLNRSSSQLEKQICCCYLVLSRAICVIPPYQAAGKMGIGSRCSVCLLRSNPLLFLHT